MSVLVEAVAAPSETELGGNGPEHSFHREQFVASVRRRDRGERVHFDFFDLTMDFHTEAGFEESLEHGSAHYLFSRSSDCRCVDLIEGGHRSPYWASEDVGAGGCGVSGPDEGNEGRATGVQGAWR